MDYRSKGPEANGKRRRTVPGNRRLKTDNWHLYVAECADGSYYTGIAKDVEKRIEAHNTGHGAKYTATRGPVRLLFSEPQKDYSAALRREYQVKSLPKKRKVLFVQGAKLRRPASKARMTFQRAKPAKRWPNRRRHGRKEKAN